MNWNVEHPVLIAAALAAAAWIATAGVMHVAVVSSKVFRVLATEVRSEYRAFMREIQRWRKRC